jgi:ribosome biogenesis protein Nip4
VYYVREDIMKRAVSVARDQLVSLGVCVGKFTHSDKFRLTIGALDLLAAHAKHKARPGPGPVSSRPARTNERRRPVMSHAIFQSST